ncbi:MAG: hypothetical protein R2749_24295 [Acidimicrobiales bacterium]
MALNTSPANPEPTDTVKIQLPAWASLSPALRAASMMISIGPL